ncbi:MAG TPA: hypothetical protein VMU10_13085 [Desulfomonilia bacterium]|nr:hypothetical protein [Desulfomonilia bacterium]
MRKVLLFFALFVFLSTQPVFAQFGGRTQQGPRFYGNFKPVVGAWAEYQMKAATKEPPTKMKIAIVGKEGDSYWYENVMDGGQGRSVMKMLVSGDPNDKKSVRRMIMKHGNDQALEMPVTGMMGNQPGKGMHQPKGKMIDKGMESVTVPAGTFQAHHMQYQDEGTVVDTWVSEKVPPYGMVKSSSKDFDMVLTGYGTGAKTLITETPKQFQMPKMPQGMPPGMMPPVMPPKGQ